MLGGALTMPPNMRSAMRQVWHCSGCGRPYITPQPTTDYGVGFDHANATVPQERPPATPEDFTNPRRWHWVGSNYQYCPGCWHDRVDQRLLGNTQLTLYGLEDIQDGCLTCVCGNDPAQSGFYPVRPTGNPRIFEGLDPDKPEVSDDPNDGWSLFGCRSCGAVYDCHDTLNTATGANTDDGHRERPKPVIGTATPITTAKTTASEAQR